MKCTFLAFVKPVSIKFKSSISMKIFIIQNDGNHSNFYLEMAVLKFDFTLPCCMPYLLTYSMEQSPS
jgi:hypothetical protein